MPKQRKFTERHVREALQAVERNGKRRLEWVFDVPGLYLLTRPGRLLKNGHQRPPRQRWIFRYTRPNKGGVTQISLGRLPYISLSEAKAHASHFHKLLAGGVDPQTAKQWAKDEGTTFGEVATAFIESRKFRYSVGWLADTTNLLQNHGKPLWDRPIMKIRSNEVHEAYKPLLAELSFQAKRAVGMWERLFRFAKAKKLFAGENPASWKEIHKELFPPLPRRGNFKGMSYWGLKTFVQALRQAQGKSTSAMLLEFIIFTVCRSGEARGMQWSEIDWEQGLWTIPAERTRARKERRIPLVERPLALLNLQRQYSIGSPYVFTGRDGQKPLAEKNLRSQLYGMGFKDKATVHGFRSSFKTWAGEQTEFPREIIEMCLGHSIGSAVEQAYWRGDALEKRRKLMEAWADFCDSR
jgi:integrase